MCWGSHLKSQSAVRFIWLFSVFVVVFRIVPNQKFIFSFFFQIVLVYNVFCTNVFKVRSGFGAVKLFYWIIFGASINQTSSISLISTFVLYFFSSLFVIHAAEPNNHLERQYPNQDLWFRVDSFTIKSIVIIDKSIEFEHTNRYLWTKSATWQCHRLRIRTCGW